MLSVHKADQGTNDLAHVYGLFFHDFRAALENDSHCGFMFPVLSQQRRIVQVDY